MLKIVLPQTRKIKVKDEVSVFFLIAVGRATGLVCFWGSDDINMAVPLSSALFSVYSALGRKEDNC